MSRTVRNRQDAVNGAPAGAAVNAVLGQVIELQRHFTVRGEALARPAGQTLARWLVLGQCAEEPSSVADIARRLHLARQSVQRVADLLEADGLCAYATNPRHRRAKLLALTDTGRATLAVIERAQVAWSNELGAAIGEPLLRQANDVLAAILQTVRKHG